MKSHPYLRAYMAGAAVPTMLMLIVLSAYCIIRFVYKAPVPLERMLVFPMAVVPNLFALQSGRCCTRSWVYPTGAYGSGLVLPRRLRGSSKAAYPAAIGSCGLCRSRCCRLRRVLPE